MRRFLAVLWILAVLLGSGCALREEPAPSEETAASTPTDPQPVCVSLTAGVRGTIQCLDGRDGRCLAVYRMDTGACTVAVYHLQTGALLGQRTMPDGIYEAELLTDGSVALLNRKTGEAFRYDEKLTQCLRQEPGWGKQWLLEESGELWALDENGAVRCTDLRGGAALCAAALAAEGETSISDITHIDRGYQSIEDDLAALGADIRRVEGTASP